MIPYEELFYVVMLLGNSAQPQQWWKRENWKRGLMSKTKALNCPTNFVRFDWNGNEIITLISKIVVSLTVTAMTLISSEIPIQRLTLYKATFISCRWCSTCCCELSTIVGRVSYLKPLPQMASYNKNFTNQIFKGHFVLCGIAFLSAVLCTLI